jgi:hypothetical protein
MTLPVFLSASEPYATRKEEYWETQNLVNIRAAVRTICAHVLRQGPLVFGGHPAITPLARSIADRIRHDRQRDDRSAPAPRLLMFQSRLYVREDPDIPDIVVTDAITAEGEIASSVGSRNLSLLRMRYEMLGYEGAEPVHPKLRQYQSQFGRQRELALFGGQLSPGAPQFRAAFFVGGMEGVIREFRIFRSLHPRTPAYPLGSTGAAAKLLLKEAGISNAALNEALERDTAYSLLLEQLLPAAETKTIAPQYHWETGTDSTSYSAADHIDPDELERQITLPP